MQQTLFEYCSERGMEYVLEEWNPEKNKGLTPKTVSRGSRKTAWWRCEKGHEWQAIIFTRTTHRTGCPICSRNRFFPGINDIQTTMPELAKEWHPTKNGDLKPTDVSKASHQLVWWQCEKGHEWQAMVKSRSDGSGCPVCMRRKILHGDNDLVTTHPDLAAQWHPTKNGDLKPSEVGYGSHRKAWWVCEKGHEWEAQILSRSQGSNCPVCTNRKIIPGENDLLFSFPAVAAEWHPTKNAPRTPDSVSPYSNHSVWWRCEKGHEWKTIIAHRTFQGTVCPYCNGQRAWAGFNDLATLYPGIAAQWHPTLNGDLSPDKVTRGSRKKVWWQCPNDHVWQAVVYSRTGEKGSGCPVCAGKRPRYQQRYEEADVKK